MAVFWNSKLRKCQGSRFFTNSHFSQGSLLTTHFSTLLKTNLKLHFCNFFVDLRRNVNQWPIGNVYLHILQILQILFCYFNAIANSKGWLCHVRLTESHAVILKAPCLGRVLQQQITTKCVCLNKELWLLFASVLMGMLWIPWITMQE